MALSFIKNDIERDTNQVFRGKNQTSLIVWKILYPKILTIFLSALGAGLCPECEERSTQFTFCVWMFFWRISFIYEV